MRPKSAMRAARCCWMSSIEGGPTSCSVCSRSIARCSQGCMNPRKSPARSKPWELALWVWLKEHPSSAAPATKLVALAENAPLGSEGVYFLPYLTGERCPHPDPCARGGWIGLTARTTRPMLIRSLLEGVTFGMRDALEIMGEMNVPISEIRASGGGARSDFWRHLQADIYNQPILL